MTPKKLLIRISGLGGAPPAPRATRTWRVRTRNMGFTQGLAIPKAQPRVRLEMIQCIKLELEGGFASEEK